MDQLGKISSSNSRKVTRVCMGRGGGRVGGGGKFALPTIQLDFEEIHLRYFLTNQLSNFASLKTLFPAKSMNFSLLVHIKK